MRISRWLISGLVIVAGALAGLYYYYLLDGAAPEQTDYRIEIDRLRELASAPEAALPTAVAVEIVARDEVPFAAVHAGGAFRPFVMARTAFRIHSPDGDVVLDTGMDADLNARFGQEEANTYYPEAYQRVLAAMQDAAVVTVTHAHPDHVGGVARYPSPEELLPRLVLTREQFARLPRYAEGGTLDPAFEAYEPIELSSPRAIAPGVVLIPAAGHTPGSVMAFVRLRSGREMLLIGDVAWAIANVREARSRPRLVQQVFMATPEDRNAVLDQIRALHMLSEREPELVIVPSHDDAHLQELAAAGVLRLGFEGGERREGRR